MWTKFLVIWEVIKSVASLYSQAKEAYTNWKINKLQEKVDARKEIMAEIGKVAAQEPTEETDEELVKLYSKLYGVKPPPKL